MITAALLYGVLAAPPLWTQVPPKTDIIVRLETGKENRSIKEVWADLTLVQPLHPEWAGNINGWQDHLATVLEELQNLTGADLNAKKASVTLALDLDAALDSVWSAVIRDAVKKRPSTADPVTSFMVDDTPAYRHPQVNWSWAYLDDNTVVLGDERGLQRQLRVLKEGGDPKDPLAKLAKRVRKPWPLTSAFILPFSMQRSLPKALGDLGHLLKGAESGTLMARGKDIQLTLNSPNAASRVTVDHGIRAAAAALQGMVALIESSGEVLLGLSEKNRKPKTLPEDAAELDLEPMLKDWVRDFSITAKLRERESQSTEASIRMSSHRAWAVVLGVLLGNLQAHSAPTSMVEIEAHAALYALMAAQMRHHENHGRFVPCEPIPNEVPVQPIMWPERSCLNAVGFSPKGKVRVQLEASVEDGRLVVVARADPDGDGVPSLWYLDERSDKIRSFSQAPAAP